MRRIHLAAVAVLAASSLAACGEDTIDASDLESQLTDQLSESAGVSSEQVSVSCPEDEKAEKGNRFECTLTAPNGDEVTVEVEIVNDEGGYEASVPPQQSK